MTKKNRPWDDDGRTVADMSGVRRSGLFTFRRVDQPPAARQPDDGTGDVPREQPEMPKQERRSYIAGALGAALLIAGVFIAAGAVLIALLTTVWKG